MQRKLKNHQNLKNATVHCLVTQERMREK